MGHVKNSYVKLPEGRTSQDQHMGFWARKMRNVEESSGVMGLNLSVQSIE